MTLAAMIRYHIMTTFEECGCNKAMTATKLGISRSTLYRHLKNYGAIK